ncbi:MAG TPA: response regulator [Candidatus Omnitrophota bacterium]|nr:response regulator [Candidatus Omnitrophota bacterium]HPS36701.1 response regulator [Candidatus Omnitrophota bacterium]
MAKKKILIVDDEVGIVQEIKEFLEEEGYEVHVADTGKEGIRLVESVKPDVVMIDMKLPDASGIDVLKACKEKSPRTKTVMITGYVDQHLMDEAEENGRDTFLQKPFDLVRVVEEIQRLLM